MRFLWPVYYNDDTLRHASYIIVYKPAPKPDIQYGKRRPVIKQIPEILDYYKIYPDIIESDPDTWPKTLRNWWTNLESYKKIKNIINDLRQYYDEDTNLLKISDWLESIVIKYNEDYIRFKYNSKLSCV
jgi:hypothetical protein